MCVCRRRVRGGRGHTRGDRHLPAPRRQGADPFSSIPFRPSPRMLCRALLLHTAEPSFDTPSPFMCVCVCVVLQGRLEHPTGLVAYKHTLYVAEQVNYTTLCFVRPVWTAWGPSPPSLPSSLFASCRPMPLSLLPPLPAPCVSRSVPLRGRRATRCTPSTCAPGPSQAPCST